MKSYFNMFDNSLLCISDYVLDREHVPYHFVDCSILFEFEQVDEKQVGDDDDEQVDEKQVEDDD